MVDIFKLYISAASDLKAERDLLSRSITEIPVTLAWQIHLSPIGEKRVDEKYLHESDLHILILGSDIRAPIGFEWYLSRQLGRRPVFFRKKGIPNTPAAGNFIRSLSNYSNWLTFVNFADLRFQALNHIGQTILSQASYFDLKKEELDNLTTFTEELEQKKVDQLTGIDGGAGEDSIILSRERFKPKGGVLIQEPKENELAK